MELHTLIGHVSVYADDPNSAASTLSALIGGTVAPFPPHKGGWVCFLSANRVGWEHEFIEFYPRTTKLAFVDKNTHPKFVPVEGGAATGAGSHVNLIVPMSALEIEAACQRVGKPHGWRWEGLMDVWLEERLMVELVPLKPTNQDSA
ncbi:MAG: hypothetical protein HOP32_09545 [Nitrospira sp.]|nr:hypothetical protein [Nitrospira sp.]